VAVGDRQAGGPQLVILSVALPNMLFWAVSQSTVYSE
jgi:hypothetical protein